jgi:hypothetical protein
MWPQATLRNLLLDARFYRLKKLEKLLLSFAPTTKGELSLAHPLEIEDLRSGLIKLETGGRKSGGGWAGVTVQGTEGETEVLIRLRNVTLGATCVFFLSSARRQRRRTDEERSLSFSPPYRPEPSGNLVFTLFGTALATYLPVPPSSNRPLSAFFSFSPSSASISSLFSYTLTRSLHHPT